MMKAVTFLLQLAPTTVKFLERLLQNLVTVCVKQGLLMKMAQTHQCVPHASKAHTRKIQQMGSAQANVLLLPRRPRQGPRALTIVSALQGIIGVMKWRTKKETLLLVVLFAQWDHIAQEAVMKLEHM
jgi:hypothetical protein